jgi:hypothetical protein
MVYHDLKGLVNVAEKSRAITYGHDRIETTAIPIIIADFTL